MQHMHQSMLADPPQLCIKSLVRDDHDSMVDLPDLDQQVISHVSLSYLQVQSGPAANGKLEDLDKIAWVMTCCHHESSPKTALVLERFWYIPLVNEFTS